MLDESLLILSIQTTFPEALMAERERIHMREVVMQDSWVQSGDMARGMLAPLSLHSKSRVIKAA